MDDMAQRVDTLAREKYPDHYAGVELSASGVVLYRKPSAELDAAVRDLPGAQAVVLRDAPHSARELERLRDDLVADAEQWRALGLEFSSVAVKADGTAVEVGTPQVQEVRRQLRERYGAEAPVEVVSAGPIALLPAE